ncbi:unnamed protein product, partial [Rotaria magnacalcarata]
QKPGKENPLLVLFDDFNDALPSNMEPLGLFISVQVPKIDVLEIPFKFPNTDGLLS